MRVRRSRTVVVEYESQEMFVYDVLTKRRRTAGLLDVELFRAAGSWCSTTSLHAMLEGIFSPVAVAAAIDRALGDETLVIEGSARAEQDIEFEREFDWGLAVARYHFEIRGCQYMAPAQVQAWLEQRPSQRAPVPLYQANFDLPKTIPLAPPSAGNLVLNTMSRRRSYRGFAPGSISLDQLRDCLYAGFAITGFTQGTTDAEGMLPLTMTPSGGARNPFEGYVYALRVEGLTPGVYHYSGVDNTLGLVRPDSHVAVGDLVAGQRWFDSAPALILLVAHFHRTMWKYPHPTGYRVVLLQAGHIAQNILLGATAAGLACAPTCAVDDRAIDGLLGLRSLTTACVYTVAVGIRGAVPTQADTVGAVPNPFLDRPRPPR